MIKFLLVNVLLLLSVALFAQNNHGLFHDGGYSQPNYISKVTTWNTVHVTNVTESGYREKTVCLHYEQENPLQLFSESSELTRISTVMVQRKKNPGYPVAESFKQLEKVEVVVHSLSSFQIILKNV